MNVGIFLNYIGLGSNLLHLSYCHEIAKKYGPVTIITLCKNLDQALEDDPNIKSVVLIDKNNKILSSQDPIYTFKAIKGKQEIENIKKAKIYNIGRKYQFLDNIFLKVLNRHPEKMPNIFFNMFQAPSRSVIKFLSNKSNILDDLTVILKMPKWLFIKNIF